MKVQEAKERCGYSTNPVLPTCGNCAAFASERQLPKWMRMKGKDAAGEPYTVEEHGVEKNLSCTDHGFTVKKMASCRLWRPKSASSNATLKE